jgi:diaminopimelate decarboxylase
MLRANPEGSRVTADPTTHFVDLAAHREEILDVLANTGTPLYLCDPEIIAARYRELDASLAAHWTGHIIGYSFKTNYEIARAPVLRTLGAWAEVVSTREMDLALAAGYPTQEIIFNGPWKSDDGLARALAGGALVNVNDSTELERIIALSRGARSPIGVGMRLSTDLGPHGRSRFGFSLQGGDASRAADRIARNAGLELIALHTHVYGDTDDPAIYASAARELAEFGWQRGTTGRGLLRFLDVGGGFPAHSPKPKSRARWRPEAVARYVESIVAGLGARFGGRRDQPRLVVEPGRYLSDDSTIMVSTVVHTAESGGMRTVNTDASISMLPLTHYRPQTLLGYSPTLARRTEDAARTIIYGATCRENDVLYDGPFPAMRIGDRLVHYGVGAYNANLSPSFIFETPPTKLLRSVDVRGERRATT